jgi:hypothetical protein
MVVVLSFGIMLGVGRPHFVRPTHVFFKSPYNLKRRIRIWAGGKTVLGGGTYSGEDLSWYGRKIFMAIFVGSLESISLSHDDDTWKVCTRLR